MATVQEILAINNRQGDAAKGGGNSIGITIDQTPFNRLAEYTYLDNVQKQKDKVIKDQEIAGEMGKAMALDPNSTNKELYEALNKKKEEINYLIKNNKDVFDYNKNPSANIKLKELLGEFTANRTKASAFDVLNNSTSTEIGKLPPEQQVAAQKVLENKRKIALNGGADNFFKTGVQLDTGIMDFKPKDFKFPKIAKLEYTTVDIGGDNNFSNEAKVIDVNAARAKAEQIWLGLQQDDFVPQPNPNKDPKIDLQNENARINSEAVNAGGKGKYNDQTVAKMNTLIEEYKQKKSEWDANPVPGKEPQKTSQMIAIDAINKDIIGANAALAKARLKDPTLKVPNFEVINYEDGLSGPELIMLETLSSQEGNFIEFTKKATNTGNATTRAGQLTTAATADKDRAERKAARIAKGQPPLPAGGAEEKGNIIYSINSPVSGKEEKYKGAKIIQGILRDKNGALITNQVEMDIPAGKTGAYIQEWYKKYNTLTKGEGGEVQVTNGIIKAKFENGAIVGILSNNGGYITVDDFQKVSDANSQLKETKYNSETEVGAGVEGTGGLP